MQRLELQIYDVIGDEWMGADARSIVRQILRHPEAREIDLFINSVGGDVRDGIAITNALSRHAAHVTAFVDSAALSIASVIVQAADERIMGTGSQMMIHNPATFFWGDRDAIEKAARMLDVSRENILDVYEQRTQQNRAQIERWMDAETWWTSTQAVAHGFADEVRSFQSPLDIDPRSDVRARAADRSSIQHAYALRTTGGAQITVPRALNLGGTNPTASLSTDAEPMATDSNTFLKRLWNRGLGRDGDPADELDVLDATRQAANAQVDLDAARAEIATLKATNAALTEQVEGYKQARAEAQAEDTDALLDAAVQDYRIDASERETWNERLGGEDGERWRDVLAELAPRKPSASGVQPPKGGAAQDGEPVRITLAESRIPSKYREARAKAKQLGTKVVIEGEDD